MPNDLRTRAIVLRRTNYGEADRILNLLTPEGKISALAKSARKEKSRLAGGIELFSVADVVIHQGRTTLGTLTSARMLQFYSQIITDLARLELASSLLKQLNRASEQITSPEHFDLLEQSLAGLNQGVDLELVRLWSQLNLARIGGEEINLLRDTAGEKLSPDRRYNWDFAERALRPQPAGVLGASEIKLARFLLSNRLRLAANVENYATLLPALAPLASTFA